MCEVMSESGLGTKPKIDSMGWTSPHLPKTLTSGNKAAGLYDRSDFIYDKKTDTYRCPTDQRLKRRAKTTHGEKVMYRYYTSSLTCGSCPKKQNCTTGKERRIDRREHERVIDALDKRMANEPERMGTRRATVEHPFGTIKSWMGHTHFLMKTMPRVATEMSLHVLSYNLKRVINIFGVQNLIRAIEA